MKIFGNLRAILRGIITTRTFYPEKVFKNKRVAIIGAADSAFEGENGRFIDSFDVVVRINKALVTWSAEKELFIGKKTDVLFHSFYENESSGGGPIQFKNFKGFGLKFLVHPNTNYQ